MITYRNPMIIIEGIIAVSLLVLGLYTVSPLYVANPTTPIGIAIESMLIRKSIGAFYVLAAGTSLWGVFKGGFHSSGSFLMALSYLFMTVLRLLTVGLIPLTWVSTLTLTLIVSVLYFRIRLLK